MNSRTQLIINDEALLHNIKCVKIFTKDCTPSLPIIAMIKANAYGHGAMHVAKILAPEVDVFGVACLEEGTALRAIMPKKPILLMGGVFSKEDWREVFDGNFDVVIHSFWQIESLLAFCSENDAIVHSINIWLKINTGMHRLGFENKDVRKAYEALLECKYINKPLGIITHFACADEIENTMTQKQIEQFELVVSSLPENFSLKRSLANSAGIMAWPNARQGYVRPGIMLYGVSPFSAKTGRDLGLKPAMSFLSHVFSIINCEAGESVGYEAIWRATKKSRIAIVAAGYGDGYPRHVNTEAKVWINNACYPIVGRVSMDMLAVDVSEGVLVQVGDVVELWGEHLPVEIVASFAKTSPYELVTQARSRG